MRVSLCSACRLLAPFCRSGFKAGLLAASVWLQIGAAGAVSPSLCFWSAEGQESYTSFDTLETNQWYGASRKVWFNAWVVNPIADPPVEINDLVVALALPPSLSAHYGDFGEVFPFYAQWNAASTSLLYRAAAPLTNESWWSASIDLASSNAWARPRIQVQRSAFPAWVGAGQSVTQEVVIDITVAANSLSAYSYLSLQLDMWDFRAAGISIETLTNRCSSPEFFSLSQLYQPGFVCTHPGLLSGVYSFTNVLLLANANDFDVNCMPAVHVTYSEGQTPWPGDAGSPYTARAHFYDNGIAVRASTPEPVLWQDQQERGRSFWVMRPRWSPRENDQPGLSSCMLFRGTGVGYDGRPASEFMFSGTGSNVVGVSMSTPDNTTYAAEVDSGEECNFELVSLAPADLARFTNGTYTVRLYDFTNALRQTYAVTLSGEAVAQTPQLLSPSTLCLTQTRPTLTWEEPSDPNSNAGFLLLDNFQLEDEEFLMWEGNATTNYDVANDLFAGCGYQLIFANVSSATADGAEILSGHLSMRYGLFNVLANDGVSLAFARAVSTAPRLFTGQSLGLGLFEFGFLPGTNCTFATDFGDGYVANETWGLHAYGGAGGYEAQVVVTDHTGAAVTGAVSAAVYDLPRVAEIRRPDGAAVALDFPTIDGARYRVAYTDSLAAPDWGAEISTLYGDGTTNTVQDLSAKGVPQRFYRLECELNP